jgi:2-methylcitrate synthase
MSSNRRLGGVQVGITEISTYGKGTGLIVRGYDIRDLGNNATFEQLAFLLLYNQFPSNY